MAGIMAGMEMYHGGGEGGLSFMFLQIKKTGEQRFYDTQTGEQVQPKKGFNPKFYM
ncbi:hypothetical protein HY797_03985 [Candidatus Falkowbacteria bacterium]|nr:hypothetical protein [Candidatus Falkowbacteria bacterium]